MAFHVRDKGTVRAMVRVIGVEPARARARLQAFLEVTGIHTDIDVA